MRLGLNVPNFGPGASPDALRQWAGAADRLGLGLLMVSDHVAVTPDVVTRYPAPFYDPFTTLAWLAGITSDQMMLGTTVVIMPYRHPLLTARMAGTLDRLSGGRLVLGVGAGWAAEEFAALDVPHHRRGAITDDYLAALHAALASDVASYHGEYARFDAVQTEPRLGAGKIWIGGSSDAALKRVVRFGDAWHPLGFRLDDLSRALARLAGLAAAAGRPVPAFAPRLRVLPTEQPVPDAGRAAGHGTLAQVAADVAELGELGAQTVVLDPYGQDPEQTLRPGQDWDMLAALLDLINAGEQGQTPCAEHTGSS